MFTLLTPFHRSLLAILALSAGATGLALTGVLLTGHAGPLYLVWNLFLALVPLALALVVHRALIRHGWSRAWLPAGLWLLFLPNAPYILTDFIHLPHTDRHWLWGHLVLLVWFSGAGLLAGLLSLRIVHDALATRLTPARAWGLVGLVSLLTGVGVYLGRFARWNSWDALREPFAVFGDLAERLTPGSVPAVQILMPWAFGAFFGLAYLVLWALGTDAAWMVRGSPVAVQSGIASAGGSGSRNDRTNPTT